MGSNPTGPTELSVQVPQNSKRKEVSIDPNNKNLNVVPQTLICTQNYEMRDLYHRQDRLAYWIQRVKTDLEDPDRIDVLKLIEHMQDRERAILWIIRCVTALLLIRKQLGKPFRNKGFRNKGRYKARIKMDGEERLQSIN